MFFEEVFLSSVDGCSKKQKVKTEIVLRKRRSEWKEVLSLGLALTPCGRAGVQIELGPETLRAWGLWQSSRKPAG